jgi:dTDP-4-dehydrorhamnose 3,5-epimerase-like enzyme
MAKIFEIPQFNDKRGTLFAIEKLLGKDFKRAYIIKNAKGIRGGHKHKKTSQLLLSVNGQCKVRVRKNNQSLEFKLDNPSKCLLLDSEDWHEMYDFSLDNILLVLASEYYDKNDYIDSYD